MNAMTHKYQQHVNNGRWWHTLKDLGIGLMAVLMTFAFMDVAWSGGPKGPLMGPGGSPDKFFEKHADRLGLDDATMVQIRAIADTAKSEADVLRQPIKDARVVMRNLLMQESPDEAIIMQQVEEMGTLVTAFRKHRIQVLLQIHALLTPAQREELRTIRKEYGGVRNVCKADVKAFCADQSGRSKFRCLHEHADDVSDACRQALNSIPSQGRGACFKEVDVLCPDMHGPAWFECMQAHQEELSEACQTRMESRRGSRHLR